MMTKNRLGLKVVNRPEGIQKRGSYNLEIGGWLFSDENGIGVNAVVGVRTRVPIKMMGIAKDMLPSGAIRVGWWHTHPYKSSPMFSGAEGDIGFSRSVKIDGFVYGIREKTLYKYSYSQDGICWEQNAQFSSYSSCSSLGL